MALEESSIMAIKWLWSEKYWLPENITWKQVQQLEDYPRVSDLYQVVVLAVLLMGVRLLVEKLVFVPIAHFYGVRDKDRSIKPNAVLEHAYVTKSTNSDEVKALASRLQWTEMKVRTWLNQRRQLWKAGKFQKLKECGWRMTYYGTIFCYGLYALWDKPWLWDVNECWTGGFVNQKLYPEIRWYYQVELAFYLSLVFSQFFDVKRKDFWQMMIHHIATIIVMGGSYVMNGVRLGSLILLCHDAADIPLEAAKFVKYIGKRRLCDVMFVVFILTWFPTRTGIYPFKLIRSALTYSGNYLAPVPFYVLNAMLLVLMVLHILWSYMILQIVHRVLIQGELDDVRSDSEETEEDEKSARLKQQ